MACRILVPWPGIEPVPLAVRAQSPNRWTTREFLSWSYKSIAVRHWRKKKKKYTEAQVCGWMCLLKTERVLMWFSCFWCFRTVQKNILDQGEVEWSSSAPDVSGWQLQPDWLGGIFPHSEAQLLKSPLLQWLRTDPHGELYSSVFSHLSQST